MILHIANGIVVSGHAPQTTPHIQFQAVLQPKEMANAITTCGVRSSANQEEVALKPSPPSWGKKDSTPTCLAATNTSPSLKTAPHPSTFQDSNQEGGNTKHMIEALHSSKHPIHFRHLDAFLAPFLSPLFTLGCKSVSVLLKVLKISNPPI